MQANSHQECSQADERTAVAVRTYQNMSQQDVSVDSEVSDTSADVSANTSLQSSCKRVPDWMQPTSSQRESLARKEARVRASLVAAFGGSLDQARLFRTDPELLRFGTD